MKPVSGACGNWKYFLFCFQYPHPMELMMYLGNDLIESVPLNLQQISQPGYVGRFKRVLKEKHSLLIQQSNSGPEFLVIDMTVSSQSGTMGNT